MAPTPKHDQRDRFHSERELAPLREEKVAKSALAEGERGRHRPGTRPDGRFPAGRRRQRKQRASYLAAARAGDPVSPNKPSDFSSEIGNVRVVYVESLS